MKLTSYIFAACLFLASGINAQPPDTLWTKSVGHGYPNKLDIIRTLDNGYAIGTATWPEGRRIYNMLFTRTDSLGNILWQRFYNRSDSDNFRYETFAEAIRKMSDGGFVLAGLEEGGALVVRTDSMGEPLWMKNLSRDEYGMRWAYGCEVGDDGNIVVVGEDRAIKLDDQRQGEVIWSRSYDIGGGEDILHIVKAAEGGYILIGRTTTIGEGAADMYVVRIDETGDILWRESYGTQFNEVCAGGAQNDDGGWCLVGSQRYGMSDSLHAMAVRITADGEEIWRKVYNQYRRGNLLRAVVQTPDSGFALAGYDGTASKFLLIRTDKDGEALWRGRYVSHRGSEGACISIMLMEDGGYTLGGKNRDGVCLIRTKPDTTHTAPDTNSVEPDDRYPASFAINSIYPNPFNSTTIITFGLSKQASTRLGIFGLDGRLIEEMNLGRLKAGKHAVTWDGSSYPAGLYLLRLDSPENQAVRKMILVK